MSKLTSWFRSAATSASSGGGGGGGGGSINAGSSTPATPEAAEKSFRESTKMAELEHALASAGLMMDDDIDGAVAALAKQDSVFHGLGLGVCLFMRSVLGFEKEVMNETSNKLADVETRAWEELRNAQRRGDGHSTVYANGTEFSLVAAESQLMSAVVSVLHESLTEGLKGFYRLRKAYTTLDAIIEAENKALGNEDPGKPALTRTKTHDHMPGSFDDDEFADVEASPERNGDEESDVEFVDAKETPGQSGTQTPLNGVPSVPAPSTSLPIRGPKEASEPASEKNHERQAADSGKPASDAALLTNPLDIFIHSGANMCFGMLLLLMSMVPPAMSRLLSIVGFRGDRARGIRMLWSATRFRNINGAVSGLVLLGYYNGLLGQSDILPPTDEDSSPLSRELSAVRQGRSDGDDDDNDDERDIVGVPREKCAALLAEMRTRYPHSGLWRLEEARGLAQRRRLRDSITLLTSSEAPKMRQVAALNAFELAIQAMFAQDWVLTRDSFLRCLELNDWSHCLYYYIAGCAELERYRDAVHAGGDEQPDETRRRKKKAEELMRKAPTVAGRKKFMSKQLPFDVYVQRKMAKLEERAKTLGVDLADAAGCSPALEMAALWCGPKRMNDEELQSMERGLDWKRCTAPEDAVDAMRKTPDEAAVRAVTLASVLRCEGRFEDAKRVLNEEALCYDRSLLKGPLKDDYALPSAHYELAAIAWSEACSVDTGSPEGQDEANVKERKRRATKVKECQEHLDTVVGWDAFVFDARLGMRVQTGLSTLRWFNERIGK